MAERPIPPCRCRGIRLCLREESDLPLTIKWRNQAPIRRRFLNSDVILPEQHVAWFLKYREKDDDFIFVIEEQDNNYRPISQVAIYNVHWKKRQGE